MAYDEHGNYDYEVSAAEAQFKPRLAQRLGERMSQVGGCAAAIGCLALVAALVVGGVYGVLYAGGRAVGAGMHDARGQK